jgi:hypothetical protein
LCSSGALASPSTSPAAETAPHPFEPPSAIPRFEVLGIRWRGRPPVVTVKNKLPKLEGPVTEALRMWNRSGIDFKWKLKPRGDADVVVRDLGNFPCGYGLATTRFDPQNRATSAKVQIGIYESSVKQCRFVHTLVAAHEFGHVLGLDHEDDTCALMNSIVYPWDNESGPLGAWPGECEPPSTDQWYCRVLAEDDLLGAESIYGGKPKVKNPEFCPVGDGP